MKSIELTDATISALLQWRVAHDELKLSDLLNEPIPEFDKKYEQYQLLSKRVATMVYCDASVDLGWTDEEV